MHRRGRASGPTDPSRAPPPEASHTHAAPLRATPSQPMSNRRSSGRRTGGERSPDQISEGFARAHATVRRLSAGRAVPAGWVPTSQRGGNGHPHRREPLSSAATASERRRATAAGGSTGGSIGDAPPFAAARPTGMRANGMWSGPRKVGGADGKDVAERPSPSSIPRRVGRVDAAKQRRRPAERTRRRMGDALLWPPSVASFERRLVWARATAPAG